MDGIVNVLFDIEFTILGFTINLKDFVSSIYSLCDWTQIQKTDFWVITSKINDLLVPTGLSLLVLFIMIEFIHEAMNIERFTWERAVMILIKFLIAKMIITNSFYFMGEIMKICQDMFNLAIPELRKVNSMDMGKALMSLFGGGLLNDFMMWALVIILYIPYLGTIIGILVQVFQRIGKLAIGFCVSPVPLALGVSEEQRGSCKGFLLWMAAVGFEGLIVIICANIYVTAIGSINASGIAKLIAVLLANGIFMALVSMSSTLSERFIAGH